MRNILFDENSQKELETKGYTIVQFLSDEEIVYLRSELNKLRPEQNYSSYKDKLSYHDSRADKDVYYKQHSTNLINKVFLPHVNRLLIECENIASSFFIKPPEKGEVEPHQHSPVTTNIKETPVVIWCPLVDVSESNGTLQVVEGSHKIVPGIFAYDYPNFFANYRETIKEYSKPINLKAGNALIFDNNLIHWSGINKTGSSRFVAVSMYYPKESKPVFYYYNKDVPKYFEVFEINRDFYLQYSLQCSMDRPKDFKSLGFVKNKNCEITEDEFVAMLKKGDEIKPEIHIYDSANETKEKFKVLKHIKQFFRD